MNRASRVMVCLLGMIAAAHEPARADVFMTLSSLITQASDGTGTASQTDNAQLPWSLTRTVNRSPASAKTTYLFTKPGQAVDFRIEFEHGRGGQAGNAARSFGMFMFSPLRDMRYSIQGAYASTGGGSTGLDVSLVSGADTLFSNVQRSRSAATHSFTVGGQAGDQENQLAGSLTGTIRVGSDYRFNLRMEIMESDGSLAASASGQLVLHLTPLALGDLDGDGDVDEADFNAFQGCMAGAELPPPSGCQSADLDQDLDVDQTDFGLFQRCMSGSGQPADPACGA